MQEAFDPDRNHTSDEIDLSTIIHKMWTGRKTMTLAIIACLIIGLGWYGYRRYLVPAQYESQITLMVESSVAATDNLFLSEKSDDEENPVLEVVKNSINPELIPLIVSGSPFLSRVGAIRIPDPKSGTLQTVDGFFGNQTENSQGDQQWLKDKIMAETGTGNTLTIRAIMPDPLTATMVADSVVDILPSFVIRFATSKACENLKFINKLQVRADSAYTAALQAISVFHASQGKTLQTNKELEEKRLQAAYKIAFDRVGMISREVEKAQFRIQAATPSFTIMQPATAGVRVHIPNLPLVILASLFAGLLTGVALVFLKGVNYAPSC
jgi:capsular polysaccharide biosynthesis protein